MDRGAWWAAVHGVAQSQTWLKQLSRHACMHWKRKWQPIPGFLLLNPRDRGAWWAAVHGVAQSQTWLKRLSMHAITKATYFYIYLYFFIFRVFLVLKWVNSLFNFENGENIFKNRLDYCSSNWYIFYLCLVLCDLKMWKCAEYMLKKINRIYLWDTVSEQEVSDSLERSED